MNRYVPPADIKRRLEASGRLSIAAINDAEFNGYVYRLHNGHAIVVPNGTLVLLSFAPELYSLHASAKFQRHVILGDRFMRGWKDRAAYEESTFKCIGGGGCTFRR